jgi:hypothetical protein
MTGISVQTSNFFLAHLVFEDDCINIMSNATLCIHLSHSYRIG